MDEDLDVLNDVKTRCKMMEKHDLKDLDTTYFEYVQRAFMYLSFGDAK